MGYVQMSLDTSDSHTKGNIVAVGVDVRMRLETGNHDDDSVYWGLGRVLKLACGVTRVRSVPEKGSGRPGIVFWCESL